MTAGLIVICGPTATGKSSLALQIATQWSLPILSADSRQVYQEFNIGTAKPTISDCESAPHYLIDVVSPKESFTLADYQEQAQALILDFQSRDITPILVGGTGLYINAVIKGLKIPRVPPQAKLRSQLSQLGQSTIYPWLQQVDADSAQKIHPNDVIRTVRALEVFYVTGKPLSQQQGECPPDYPILQIGLNIDAIEPQTQIIRDRTQAMVQAGWLAEVQELIDTYGEDLPLLKTLGYHEMMSHLNGTSSLSEAKEQTVLHTRQFAKRQRTWFRTNQNIHWFNPLESESEQAIMKQVATFLNNIRAIH